MVNVQILYKVGSARESIGKSGFAHFFEHMMFQGSLNVKDEEHFKIVSEAGGDMNGNTTRDRTMYYNNVPSNQLEVALWLESDRMGFLLDSLTSRKFENQRDAVKNEKSQNFENQPYAMAFTEFINQTLYPPDHPYSWPVIGYLDDLNRASLDDVKNFFLRWYGPNNAILTVAGDIDPKNVLALVEKYFGPFKPGPEVKKAKIPAVVLPNDKYMSYRDNVYLPMSLRTYPTVPQYHRDEAPLELMASMLGDGNNSLMYKNFVKSKFAAEAGVSYGSAGAGNELAGEMNMHIFAYPPEDFNLEKMFNDMEAKVKTTLDEFEKTGITDESLLRAKSKMESQTVDITESIQGKATVLAYWEWLNGGKKFNMTDELDRYNKVAKEDIARVFNKYIKGAGAAVVNVYPKTSAKDSVKSIYPYTGVQFKDDPQYSGLTYNRVIDNIDRAKRPAASAPKLPTVPDFYQSKLANGLEIIGTKVSETSKIVLYFEIEGGDLVLKPEEMKKNGIAEFTGLMMNESTKNFTAEQISAELEKLGSAISINGSKDGSSIYVTTLKKNLDATLKVLDEKLFNPKFDAEDFKRVKKQYKESIASDKKSPQSQARKAYMNILYGNTILGLSPTSKNIEGLELADLKSYYENYYSPSVTKLVITGDIDEKEILPKLDFLNKWKAKEVIIPPVPSVSAVIEPQIYLVNKDFAPSSVIYMGQVSEKFDATGEYFKNTAANFVLGGNFNSRLNLNLRENKGYTYGIFSATTGNKYTGRFTISASVKRSSTAASLAEIMKEVSNYKENGVSDEDVAFTKNSMLNSEALQYETPDQKASFLYDIAYYKLDKDFKAKQAAALKLMSKEDFNAQIKKMIDPSKMAIVIVGDKDMIKDQLEKMNVTNVKDFNDKLNVKKVKNIDLD